MNFRYDKSKKIIESDDPTIFVQVLPHKMETGREFILHIGGEKFGFRTARNYEDDQSEVTAEGSYIWRIGEACCTIRQWDDDSKSIQTLVEERFFVSSAEQDASLKKLLEALSVFSGLDKEGRKIPAKGEVTKELEEKILAGKMIK